MAEKRRDNKGRLLRQGELQREDGKYEYRYFDLKGNKHSIYSWKLVETDKIPKGKRQCRALRDLEKEIQRDLDDGVNSYTASRMTLNQYFDDYMSTKIELKPSTRTNYKYMYNKYVRDDFGERTLASIKFSDVKKFYIHLIHDCGFKPNSMEIINTIIHPVFTIAVRDGLIRTNPASGVMADIKRSHNWEKPKRHALTEAQQTAFIEYVKNSRVYAHWMPLFTLLLGTGCRIGEAIGLRWEDCDFENRIISINHSLIYRQQEDGSGCKFSVSTPKTTSGIRIIPMFDAVKDALLAEREKQELIGFNQAVIDGYSGFIFANRYGDIMNPSTINHALVRIIRDYNKAETKRAEEEKRSPEFLPHFSVHNLRHTFCTRFCENETNLKIIQEIMGHADITTTMDVYNEATKEKKVESFAKLEGKIKIN